MNRKVIALALLLTLATPLAGYAEPTEIIEETTVMEIGLNAANPDAVLDEPENTRMENLAISAATGAAIGSVWPGPGTAIGLVVGGIYGFFFK